MKHFNKDIVDEARSTLEDIPAPPWNMDDHPQLTDAYLDIMFTLRNMGYRIKLEKIEEKPK